MKIAFTLCYYESAIQGMGDVERETHIVEIPDGKLTKSVLDAVKDGRGVTVSLSIVRSELAPLRTVEPATDGASPAAPASPIDRAAITQP